MKPIDGIKKIIHRTSNNTVDSYKNLKLAYTKFVSDMKTSDFCNSPQRYISECKLLKNLQNLAAEKGLTDEIPKLTELLKHAENELTKQGIKIDF